MPAVENTTSGNTRIMNNNSSEETPEVGEKTSTGPNQTVVQRNEFDILQGFLSLIVVGIVCGAYHVAWVTVDRGYVALAPVPVVAVTHVLYLAIYTLKNCVAKSQVSTGVRTLAFILQTSGLD